MNIVKELRKKAGLQQKELAIAIGVSRPTVSEWESNKKDPSKDRLKKLSEYFGVDELIILGKGVVDLNDDEFVETGKPYTDEVRRMILRKLGMPPKTQEARILASGVDKLPQEQREQALNVVRAMFSQYADYFDKETNDDP